MKRTTMRVLGVLLSVLLVMSLAPLSVLADEPVTGLAGEGTSANPYQINSLAELKWFRDDVNAGNTYSGKYIKLMADIDLAKEEWTPIGNNVNQFKGYFDGGNHEITGLRVTNASARYAGFFGYIRGNSMSATTIPSVKDLTLTDVVVKGDYFVGGLAGQGYVCNITNVTVQGTVSGVRYIGGLVGHVYTHFEKCTFKGDVICSFDAAGGIAGAGDCRAYNCTVYGGEIGVSGSNWVGGIIGNGQEGTSAVGCYVKANVNSDKSFYAGVGGIAGVAGHGYASSEFSNNYFDGVVTLEGEKINAPIAGIINADESDVKAELSGNSWNPTHYPVDLEIGFVIPTKSDTSASDYDELPSVQTQGRNNNLVMLPVDLNFVDAEDPADVVIMDFSDVTEGSVESAIVAPQAFEVNGVCYRSFADAQSVVTAGSTIKLVQDYVGAGFEINKSIVLDFNGKVITVTSPVAGSDGIAIKSGLNVTLKNGAIVAASNDVYALIQNSANLTVEDMTIRGGNAKFALSNNICKVQILGDTNIYAQNIAFDVYAYCTVTVNTTGVIDGNIQVSGKNASLTVENGNFTVAPKAEWLAENAILTEKANGTYLVKKAVGIVGTNMTLGSALNVNFYVNKADLKGIDYYAIITETAADGTVKTVKVPYAAWTAKGDLLKITFQGLAAKEMSDTLTIQIFDSNTDVAVSKLHKDSVRDYAMRVLAKAETTAKEKTLIVDMLNYGAAAQKFFNYNTENLANALLSDEQKGFATAEVTAEDKRVKGEKYVGSMLKLENSVQLVLVFEGLTEDMVAMVTYEGQSEPMILDSSKFVYNSNGQVAIVIDTLEPADASKVVTCMIVDGGEVISTVSDSIESYVARVNNGAGANELYDAILKFAASAAANK